MKKIKLHLDCIPEEAARRAVLYSSANEPPLDGYVSVNPPTIKKLPIAEALSIERIIVRILIDRVVIHERDADGIPTKLTLGDGTSIHLLFSPCLDGGTELKAVCEWPELESYLYAIIEASAGRAIESKSNRQGGPDTAGYIEIKILEANDASAKGIPAVQHLEWLRQNIVNYFDESDLRDLCFSMGIDYDDLPGQSKKDKARELVARCKHTTRTIELVAKLRNVRPTVSWEGKPE